MIKFCIRKAFAFTEENIWKQKSKFMTPDQYTKEFSKTGRGGEIKNSA